MICLFLICLVAGIVGTVRIKDGLDLTDIVPRFTKEHKFLEGQSKYFGFYNFFAVTQVLLRKTVPLMRTYFKFFYLIA